MKLVYFVGAPGVGKTTLMEALTARCERQSETKPFAHDWLYRDTTPVAIELGRRRESFSGTDALSMSVQPKAIQWLGRKRHELLLAEGARLANLKFFYAARDVGYQVVLFYLIASNADLDARRVERGSSQKPSWMKGAATRARKVADQMRMDATVHWVTTSAPLEDVVATTLKLEPALKVLNDD